MDLRLQDTACIRQKGKIYNLKVSHITLVDIFLHVHYNKHRKNTHGIPKNNIQFDYGFYYSVVNEEEE